jgi:hypothetical protein
MPYERMHGREEGIAERLKMWRKHLATDRRYPWLGTGICDDLVTAARLLGADVSEFETDPNQPTLPEVVPAEPVQQALVYDL